jgi:hypothetical protein
VAAADGDRRGPPGRCGGGHPARRGRPARRLPAGAGRPAGRLG